MPGADGGLTRHTCPVRTVGFVAAWGRRNPMESQQSALDRRSIGGLTVEQIAYIVLILAAVLLRTYDLGVRPYHHDESLHSFF